LCATLVSTSFVLELRFVGQVSLLDVWAMFAVLSCAVIGALIVSTHHSHLIGWMFCGAALSFGFATFAGEYAIQS
jgi:hypothetical protein